MLNFNSFSLAVLVGLAATLSSCSIKEDRIDCPSELSNVTVDVRTFEYEMTKSSSASDAIQRLVFKAFDANGKVAYETTQTTLDAGFGTVECRLAPGTYTLAAVGHKVASTSDASATLDSPTSATFPTDAVQETFSGTSSITVKAGVDFATAMTLPQIISRFAVHFNDAIPSNVASVKIVANSSASAVATLPTFDPSTGFALADRSYTRTYSVAAASIGASDVEMSCSLFLTAATQTINAVATAYDADGNVIISHTFTDVPMKQNRKTIAKGEFFSAGGSGSFLFNTDWDSDATVSY